MARPNRSGGSAGNLLNAVIADLILDTVGGVVKGVVNPGGGGIVSPPIPAAQGSKFNLTAPDIIAIQRQVDDENYRRASTNQAARALGQKEPFNSYLDANQIINNMVYTNRQLMNEAGERERMLAEIGARGRVQEAQIAAEGATARQAVDSTLANARAIDTELLRRVVDPSLTELARPI